MQISFKRVIAVHHVIFRGSGGDAVFVSNDDRKACSHPRMLTFTRISAMAALCVFSSMKASARQDGDADWAQIQQQFKCPQWFSDAKFGIWAHWGAQSQPARGGGWYARHMYMQELGKEAWGKSAHPYHLKTYGHPSEKGFKDVIHSWKAEKLDTDALLGYFKSIGAKYFVALANHHDHFDNFASTHQPWNSVNVGPKRDIIGEFSASSKKIGMPFGVSSHDDRMLMFYEHAFGSDKSGPKKGVPYDGNLTKEDGKGTWWEGLDPADLYGLPPARRTPEWIADMKRKWELRHKELVGKYQPDMLWFDGRGFPYGDHGKEVSRMFYNQSLRKNGRIDSVVVAKIPGDPAIINDIERGVAEKILPHTWQGTTTFTSWFYKEDIPSKHNARTIIEMLTDVISKNGNLLLNVELFPDGTIPPEQKGYLDEVGAWVNLNAEAIFASKPWVVHGDNLNSGLNNPENAISEADLKDAALLKKRRDYNERTVHSPPYDPGEVRFTVRDDKLFVFVLNPAAGRIRLASLGLDSVHKVKTIRSIRLLGSSTPVVFTQQKDALLMDVPTERPNRHAAVFEITGAL